MVDRVVAVLDCTNDFSRRKIWGVSLCERILRRLSDEGVSEAFLFADSDQNFSFRRDFKPRFPIHTRLVTSLTELKQALPEGTDVLFLDGNAAYDNRLIRDVISKPSPRQIEDGTASPPVLLRLHSSVVKRLLTDVDESKELPISLLRPEIVTKTNVSEYNTYDDTLKSHTRPLFRKVTDNRELTSLERYVSKSQSKVVLDFVAISLDAIFTWLLVKPLSKTWVTPNMLTVVIIAIQVMVVPVFFAGWIVAGLILEWIMTTLDSCDGKLARLTIRQSEKYGWLEHRTSYWSTSLWYFAIGWHLAAHDVQSPSTFGGIALFAIFWIDRRTVSGFLRTMGRSVYAFSLWDIRVSYVIARRNISIFILTIAVFIEHLEYGFWACVIWSFIGWLYHATRLLMEAKKSDRKITFRKKVLQHS